MNTEQALRSIQNEMNSPDWLWLLGEFEKLLADTPADELENRVNEVARLLVFTLKQMRPDMSESMLYSLPYSFSRLLLDRIRMKKAN